MNAAGSQPLGQLLAPTTSTLKAGARARAMDYANSSRACSLLTTARALLQERRVTHCGMPHCDMPQLHRFPPDTIVNSVACEDAVSTTPDLS